MLKRQNQGKRTNDFTSSNTRSQKWTSFIARCDINFLLYVFFNNNQWDLPSWPKEAEQRPSDTGIIGVRNFLASFDIPDKLDIADNYISLIWTNGVFRTNTGTPDKDFFPTMISYTNILDKEALIRVDYTGIVISQRILGCDIMTYILVWSGLSVDLKECNGDNDFVATEIRKPRKYGFILTHNSKWRLLRVGLAVCVHTTVRLT